MKDPGNVDVLENSAMYENNYKGRSIINCRFQVSGYQLQVRTLFKHAQKEYESLFLLRCLHAKKKKASVDIPRSLFLNC